MTEKNIQTSLKDYGFKDQITRSGLSIPSNIAEEIERESACTLHPVLFSLSSQSCLKIFKGRTYEKSFCIW
ncbi:MAG: four helix bundle protein [Deltaproteobacteria bacterium]|nr:four helix bundle protein [Deltaproteobacteria bacterium]MBW2663672.1 four helix bundle protein [Deltaproteobacteria bacterium]